MGRSVRAKSADTYYHVIARCNNNEFLFKGHRDFVAYTSIMRKYKKLFDFKLFAYSLLNNHMHILLKTGKSADISEVIQRINGVFASWYNYAYKRKGHFWQDRFKSYPIEDDDYFLRCQIYIDLNAVRAGIVEHPRDWPHSSVYSFLKGHMDNLIAESPIKSILGRNDREYKDAYVRLLNCELKKTRMLKEALIKKDKREIRQILADNCSEPIPFKIQISRLFNMGIGKLLSEVSP